MVDEVKAVDTKGVELKTLDTLAMSWLKRWDKLGFHMGIFFEIFFGMQGIHICIHVVFV